MKTAATLLFVSMAYIGIAQLPPMDTKSRNVVEYYTPTHTERYGVDYELTDYTFTNGDSLVLEKLNLSALEEYRQQDQNVQVVCPYTLLTVTLYSRQQVYDYYGYEEDEKLAE